MREGVLACHGGFVCGGGLESVFGRSVEVWILRGNGLIEGASRVLCVGKDMLALRESNGLVRICDGWCRWWSCYGAVAMCAAVGIVSHVDHGNGCLNPRGTARH